MSCEYEGKIILYKYGECADSDISDIRAHLAVCETCREELKALDLTETMLDSKTYSPKAETINSIVAAAQEYLSTEKYWKFSFKDMIVSFSLSALMIGFFSIALYNEEYHQKELTVYISASSVKTSLSGNKENVETDYLAKDDVDLNSLEEEINSTNEMWGN